jgi:hypothetical protein
MLVVFHLHILTFVWLLAKCVIPTIAVANPSGHIGVGMPPPPDQFASAVSRMRELLLAMRLHQDPARAPVYFQSPNWSFKQPVEICARYMELFIFAHEYGHLVINRGDGSIPAIEDASPLGIELQADLFGYAVVLRDADSKSNLLPALSPLILFKFLSLMERHGIVPVPIDHPSSADRMALLFSFFKTGFSKEKDLPQSEQTSFRIWNFVAGQIEIAWEAAMQDAAPR